MAAPIVPSEVFAFGQAGLKEPAMIRNTSLAKDRCLCVSESSDQGLVLVMVDLKVGAPNGVRRMTMRVDTFCVHPDRNVLAVASGNVVQVYDLDQKAKIAEQNLPQGYSVNYWKWIDNETLALLTGGIFVHLSIRPGQALLQMFQLDPAFGEGSIMGYDISADGMWMAVTGLVREGDATVGKMQLFSRERKVSQVVPGCYAAAFATFQGGPILMCAIKDQNGMRVMIMGLGSNQAVYGKRSVDCPIGADDPASEYPLHIVVSEKYSTAFLFTKSGFLYMIEYQTPFVYMSARSFQSVVVQAAVANDGNAVALGSDGRLQKFMINDSAIVEFVGTRRGNPQAASRIAAAAGLQVSGDFVNRQFDAALASGNIEEAARLAISSQGSTIRNLETIQKIQRLPVPPGAPAPFLKYFSILLESSKLNEIESLELCRFVLARNQAQLVEKWIKEDKLTVSEELGDLCKSADPRLALAVYLRTNSSAKIVATFAENGAFDKVQAYCQKFSYTPNWMQIATIAARSSPDKCDALLSHIANNGKPLCDVKQLIQMLLQFQLIRQAIAFLIDVLDGDREEDSDLQTMLFEIALTHVPKIAEELFARNKFSFYDRQKIAALCERANNFQRALEHYTDLPSIKRCIVNTQTISDDFLVSYFGTMSPDWAMDCLRELLTSNPRQNVQVVVKIATRYWDQFGVEPLLNLFKECNSNEGGYYFLAGVVGLCDDPDVQFRYIEASVKMGNYQEAERMCRESQSLQPERVRDYLMQQDIPDKVPLIVLCNRFQMIEDLTKYLYKKGATRELEAFVQKYNPAMAGRVVGGLLDMEAPIDYIQKLLSSVQHTAPIDELIRETMKRDRIKLLEPILYARQQAGATDTATHNGLVLLAVLSNRNGERVLRENDYYDPKFVGDILTKRDAHLACLAYAKGNCDDELLELTNQHQLYKEQARYLVARQSPELWARVLSAENEHMKLVVDAVISTALPECDNTERVQMTVQAFMAAEIPTQLIGLLEKIVMENSSPQFRNNGSLQNLLIITAIKSDTTRVMTYVTRLGEYAWERICQELKKAQLYDEAVAAYKKFGRNVEAVQVMIDYQNSIQAAADWAQHCNEPAVWSEVGRAQLANEDIVDAIDSFIKAKDTKEYQKVIEVARKKQEFKALVQFLTLARQIQNRDPLIETELCFAYAKTDMLSELEELTSSPNSAREREVADRCFDEGLFKAARILYNAIKEYTRLTETLLKLEDYGAALEAARKAGSSNAWKAVNEACVKAGDFKTAQTAGLQVVVEADLVDDVIKLYEGNGYFAEIIQLLEAATTLERAHGGIFTQLAVLYARHQPEKVMEHLKVHWQRLALFRVISQLNEMHMWSELCFAYEKYNEFDNAVIVMMEHPSIAWNHQKFKELIALVSNTDLLNRALNFYLMYSPLDLNELLSVIGQKVDVNRVIDTFTRNGKLQLIKGWLGTIQSGNIQCVNEALNSLHVEDGDYDALRHSIDSFDLFDGISLANELRRHECMEFRRISSYLYRKLGRWSEAIELSKSDQLYGDCIETAAQSRSPEVVEGLLREFVQGELFECFAAATFVCYDLVAPDLILELAWRNKCMDFAMPYLIQSLREQNQTIAKVTAKLEEMSGKVEETKEIAQQAASVSQAPPGFATQAPFPEGTFTAQFPDQGFVNSGSFPPGPPPAADPFQGGQGYGNQGQFPAFPNQFPPNGF